MEQTLLNDQVVCVTDEACEHIAKQLEHRTDCKGIKIGVKSSGCSGLAYYLEFVDADLQNVISFTQKGINFYINPDHKLVLQDAVLYLKTEGLNSGLEFENPNATGTCGCGESFAVD